MITIEEIENGFELRYGNGIDAYIAQYAVDSNTTRKQVVQYLFEDLAEYLFGQPFGGDDEENKEEKVQN
jgi:hypothetical protein